MVWRPLPFSEPPIAMGMDWREVSPGVGGGRERGED